MQTSNFTCGHCGNLMAVGQEYLGQQVRCPHCQQVVQAPSAAPAPVEDLGPPVFSFTPSREEESIFAPRQLHDDIFDEPKPPPVLEMPPEPAVPSELAPPASPPPMEATAELAHTTEWLAPAEPENDATFASAMPAAELERPVVRRPAAGSRLTSTILIFLVPYAIFITGVAIYYYTQMRARDISPLEMFPDVPSENPGATRKGGSVSNVYERWRFDTALPAKLRVHLGKTIRIGELEVTPEIVRQGKVVFCEQPANHNPQPSQHDALILTLRLRNLSADQYFYPTDPAFLAQWKKGNKPYTFLEMGTERFFGGPIPWVKGAKKSGREYLQGQEHDNRPLGPNQQRTTVVSTDPENPAILNALRTYRGPLVWRVQLRRGLVAVRDKEVSAAAVIGVEFAANEIQRQTQ